MAVLHESVSSDVASANELYREIVEIDPLNYMALNNLAVNLKSLEMMKRTQGLSPSEVTTSANLGLLEYHDD